MRTRASLPKLGVHVDLDCGETSCKGTARFTKRAGRLTAAHIHKNVGGKPGPILHWLGTTSKWNHGAHQMTPGANAPCCSNKRCDMVAPKGTRNMKNKGTRRFRFNPKIASCSKSKRKCAAHKKMGDNILVVHGKNFRSYGRKGCKTKGPIGVDPLGMKKFTRSRKK